MSRSSHEFVRQAVSLYRKARYDAALRLFSKGLRRFPEDKDLALGRAMCRLKLGDYAFARDDFEALRKEEPYRVESLQGLTEAYLSLGRPAAAAACARAVLRGLPGAETANVLGLMFHHHGRVEEAARCHAIALRQDPGSARAYLGLAAFNRRKGRLDRAVRLLERSLKANPGDAETLSYLGNLYFELGLLGLAEQTWSAVPPRSHVDPVAVKRFKELAAPPKGGALARALDSRLRKLRARDPGIRRLLDSLAPRKRLPKSP